MDYEKIAKSYRKKTILDTAAPTMHTVSYDKQTIESLLPHRDPFLLIDRIDGIDLTQQGIVGGRRIDPSDPVFEGHFPSYPILPGVLQIEMIGQLAICFFDFHQRQSVDTRREPSELGVRALKIYHTLFQHEILPGDDVTVMAKLLDKDDFIFKGIGQVLNDGKVCTIAIAEFYIV